jgi:hypothetical protein
MFRAINTRENFVAIPIIFLSLFISLTFIVNAQSPEDNIEFPITELGGCENKEACHTYCDDLSHINECVDFAEAHNLMSPREADLARKFSRAGGEGPGHCLNKKDCEAYCENISNIEECLAFSEEHDVLDNKELDEARRVAKALREGAELPGGCRNKNECEIYCEDPQNIDQCLAFAEAAGFLPPEEIEHAKKFAEFMKRGETPGGCRGHGECEAYCNDESNLNECASFAEKAGLISPEEAELFRKTGGKGPGGCQDREECENFCNNPNNQEECFAFAKDHGLISKEELRHMEEGGGRLNEALINAPPEVTDCLRERIGVDNLEALRSGNVIGFSEDRVNIEHEIENCFREAFGSGSGENSDGFDNFLDSAPPEVIDCVRSQVGADFERAATGERTDVDIRSIVNECFNKFAPLEPEDNEEHGNGFDEIPEEFRDQVPGDFKSEDFNPENFEEFIPEEFKEFRPEDFDATGNHEFEREFQEEFQRQVEEEYQKQYEQDLQRTYQEEYENREQEILENHDIYPSDTKTGDFLSPSAFSPRNLNQQGASLIPFIINR